MKKKLPSGLIRSLLVIFSLAALNQGMFLAARPLQGQTTGPELETTRANKIFRVKIKGAYFHPTKTSFQEIYRNRWMGETEFTATVFKFLDLWLGGNYYSGTGKLPVSEEDTNMTIIGVAGGLKFRVTLGAFSPYLGFGPLVYFYKEKNPVGTAEGNNIGFIGQGGCYLSLYKGFFLDFFIAYTNCEVQPQRIKVDLGGIYGGIGLGFSF